MSVFAIADTHLSFSTNKQMDIFGGWEDYIAKLEKNWRNIIKENDSVVIAGDISWGMSLQESLDDFRFLNDLPGDKFIIKGNHDYWWSTRSKMECFFKNNSFNKLKIIHNNAYACEKIAVCGTRGWFFDSEKPQDSKILLREAGRLNISINEAKKTQLEPVVFLHYPPLYGNMVCDEIMDVLIKNKIKKCYYGHLHGQNTKNAVVGKHYGIDFRLISCDFTGFTPVAVIL